MALLGFDKSYYLDAKLNDLKTELPEWADKDTVFLEDLLMETSGLTPEMHYSLWGYMEGLEPNAFFNHEEYRFAKAAQLVNQNYSPDMEQALEDFDSAWTDDSYLHYLEFGAGEKLNPSNSFDESQYLSDKLSSLQTQESTSSDWSGRTIEDLRSFLTSIDMTVVDHYINYGIQEGLTVSPVPAGEQVDTAYTPWNLPHENVELPSTLNLEWVDETQIITQPNSAIGLVIVTLSGQSNIATGFMISPEHVLTSAHALLDDSGQLDSAADIAFIPGLNGEAASAESYDWQHAWVQTTFDENLYSEWPDNDLGIIKLTQPLDDTIGYLNLEPDISIDLTNTSIKTSGYSAGNIEQDNPATPGQDYYQWEVSGTLDSYLFDNGALELSDNMEVTAGSSGSPIYYLQDDNIYFAGVLSGSLGDNMVAAALDQDSYNWILGILQQDGYYI